MEELDRRIPERAAALLRTLHGCGECSGREEKTRALLEGFLRENTSLELHGCGQGFYAARRGTDRSLPGIVLRADYDALPLPEGGAAHLCGHDGHAAALCGVALALETMAVRRSVFLLFQGAEETGEGAKGCLSLFDRERVAAVYGAHNLPGLPLGQVYTRPGTFACASQGLTLRLTGSAAHAAYPELGASPAQAVGRLLCELPELAPDRTGEDIRLCTVIGAQVGEKAFGMAASRAEVWLTLRAERDEALAEAVRAVAGRAEDLAREAGLTFAREDQDVFPATVNDPACARRVLDACGGKLLERPMRWSEDFGHYLRRCPGAFFGIGAGETCAPLHSDGYRYPEELLEPAIRAFTALLDACCGA